MKPIDGRRGEPDIDRRTAEAIRKAAKQKAARQERKNA